MNRSVLIIGGLCAAVLAERLAFVVQVAEMGAGHLWGSWLNEFGLVCRLTGMTRNALAPCNPNEESPCRT